MSGNIRKQAILSSLLVYAGFLVGAINTYFYVREGSFTPDQNGLVRLFFDVAQNFYVWGSLGFIPVVYKFYPYYKDNLSAKENDLLSWSLLASLTGAVVMIVGGYLLEPLVVRKYSERSLLFVQYYHLIFPFSVGMLLFATLEGYSWALHKSVFTNFLKETLLRIITTVFILLYYFGYIRFHTFIHLFCLLYFIIFLVLLLYLIRIKQFQLTVHISRVTRKFWKKMLTMQSILFGGIAVQALAQTIDSLIIATLKGLPATGIFNLAQYAANLVQVPQRSMQSVTTGILSQHWKDKNYTEINRIYQRSCINLLLFGLFIYGIITLNIATAFEVLPIQKIYAEGIAVMILLGVAKLIDAGTGVNGTIIGTSIYWRFDFFSGLTTLALRIPLTYYAIKNFGLIGSAYAEIISVTVYNSIRYLFLKRKFGFEPFNQKTVLALLTAVLAFASCYWLPLTGFTAILVKSFAFTFLMILGVFYFELTPDAMQLYYKYKEKLSSRRS
jgi:O-antigen/teichoic acid export membrane protein